VQKGGGLMTFRVIVTTSVAALAVSFLLGHWAMDESRMSLLPRCKFACYNTDEFIDMQLESVTVAGEPVSSVEEFFAGKLPDIVHILARKEGSGLFYSRKISDPIENLSSFSALLVRK